MLEITAGPGPAGFEIADSKPGVTSIIAGSLNEKHVQENLTAFEWTISDSDLERIDKILTDLTSGGSTIELMRGIQTEVLGLGFLLNTLNEQGI